MLDYAALPRWKFPYAPHTSGFYPQANGQVYGGGETSEEKQMPVEESANLLILAAVVSRLDGNTKYADHYWPLLAKWAGYLKQQGLDPANQLCTDDFMGHLAHNANLSIKAIIALRAYGEMCRTAGKADEAEEYVRLAARFAGQWIGWPTTATTSAWPSTSPARGPEVQPGWDKALGFNLFPPEVIAKEFAFYKGKLNPYGLPLDNRKTLAKLDWEVWTATLARSPGEFDALMEPVYAFVSQTPDRVPLSDGLWSDTGRHRASTAPGRSSAPYSSRPSATPRRGRNGPSRRWGLNGRVGRVKRVPPSRYVVRRAGPARAPTGTMLGWSA